MENIFKDFYAELTAEEKAQIANNKERHEKMQRQSYICLFGFFAGLAILIAGMLINEMSGQSIIAREIMHSFGNAIGCAALVLHIGSALWSSQVQG